MTAFKRHGIGYIFIAILLVASILSSQTFFQRDGGNGEILNGEAREKYEKQFDANLVHVDVSTSLWMKQKHKFFNEGTKGVLIGTDGWLFTDEEFLFDNNYLDNIANNQKYILSTVEELSHSEVRVIIVPIPAKSRIYEEYLGQYEIPKYRQDIYQNFLEFLKQSNITSIDTLKIFTEYKNNKIFFKTDTHWTPLGARLTAKTIGKKSNKIGKGGFIPTKNKEATFQGDLVKFTSDSHFNDELFMRWQTQKTVSEDTDLFVDKYFPVVLIGTSYSADTKWNFEGFLKEFLQQDVLNLSNEGMGPFEIMDNYISNQFKTIKHPKILIWEIPERYLPVLFDGAK